MENVNKKSTISALRDDDTPKREQRLSLRGVPLGTKKQTRESTSHEIASAALRAAEAMTMSDVSCLAMTNQQKRTLTDSNSLVRMVGLEPTRNHFHGILSPACLPIPPHPHQWSEKRGSNPRPSPWQGDALAN